MNEPLADLLAALRDSGYRFTAVTPATHARVIGRREESVDLRDAFGWNRPFREGLLPGPMLDLLRRAGAVEEAGGLLKSKVRVASIGTHLFLHSSYPTVAEDAVFFGPDTYRFVTMVRAELERIGDARRLVDVGAGGGAGGILAAAMLPGARITLTDVNPEALRLASINARHAGVEVEPVACAGLEKVEGPVDLIIANPPYVMDERDRAYRDGGGMRGAELSLDWTLEGARRLEPGGHMLLYTGVAIADGRDALREALERALPPLGCTLRYREIDPDIFGEELEKRPYRDVERIAAVGGVVTKQ